MIRIACLSIFTFLATLALPVQDAEAGPLLDWIRGLRNRRAYRANCNTCNTYTNTALRPVQANPMGLQPGQCARTCMKTCSRTVVNYVPQTCYRTAWNRVPVTQYRPVTNSDPCTGCTVTCMRPCTTYTWQMRRVPYTTYRPVYRTQTYRVPVTTITNDCANGNCNVGCATGNCGVGTVGCDTCGVPTTGSSVSVPTPATTNTDGVYYTDPNGNPIGGGLSTPADQPPTLNQNLNNVNPATTQAPSVLQRMQETATSWPNVPSAVPANVRPANTQNNFQPAPTFTHHGDQTAEHRSPVRERWSYSPIRLASYTKVENKVKDESNELVTVSGTMTRIQKRKPNTRSHVNSGWSSVSW